MSQATVKETAHQVKGIQLYGPGGGTMWGRNLGNTGEALEEAAKVFAVACAHWEHTAACELQIDFANKDGSGRQKKAIISMTDGVLYLTLPA